MKTAYKILKDNREFIDDLDALDPELISTLFGIHNSIEQEQLMALIAVIKNDSFEDDPLLFENLVLILNGVSPFMGEYETTQVEQIWYALFIIGGLRPTFTLNERVKGYIKFIHDDAGFYIYPKESNLKTPMQDLLPDIIKRTDKREFLTFDISDNHASKLNEIIDYIDVKAKEDGVI